MKKLLPYVLAFHAALAAAILLWALQEKFPGPLTNTLSPVWNSPWEMGKAAFFPLLAAAPTLWVLQKGGSRGGLCLMALSGAALALALAWTPLAPAAVAVLAITAALALYAALWRRVSGDALPWYLLTAALSVAYILLTILPPRRRHIYPVYRGDRRHHPVLRTQNPPPWSTARFPRRGRCPHPPVCRGSR